MPERIPDDLLSRILEAFRLGRYSLRLHGFERMLERDIHPQALRQVVLSGRAIEFDPPGHRGPDASLLFTGRIEGNRPVHVKVAERITPSGFRHFVVTAYEPSSEIWEDDFTRRRSHP